MTADDGNWRYACLTAIYMRGGRQELFIDMPFNLLYDVRTDFYGELIRS